MYSWHLSLTILAVTTVSVLAIQEKARIEAIAHLSSPDSNVKGKVIFVQTDCGEKVYVRVQLEGLSHGKHGFHVHEKGDMTNGCLSMGGHFNPKNMEHGDRSENSRHVGDLGNIEADANGVVDITFEDQLISLSGLNNIIGLGLVVHNMEDDLGKGRNTESKTTGNSGRRVACGIIGVSHKSSKSAAQCCSPAIQPPYQKQTAI